MDATAEKASGFSLDTSDLIILLLIAIVSIYYFTRRQGTSLAHKRTVQSASQTANSTVSTTIKKGGKLSVIEKLEELESDRLVALFYGSQTGTAEDLANRFAKEINASLDVPTVVCDLEDLDMETLTEWPTDKQWLAGFFLATYGEGEPTDNAVEFFEWLMDGKKSPPEVLEQDFDDIPDPQPLPQLNYVMFGLGNKTYEHFNAMVRMVDKRLRLWGGAKLVGQVGEGDDDGSLEEDFLKWKPNALTAVGNFFGLDPAAASVPSLDKPHAPAFKLITSPGVKRVFAGELGSNVRTFVVAPNAVENRGRRGTLKPVVKYVEKDGVKKATYDARHPYYSLVVDAFTLFKDCLDQYTFAEAEAKHLDYSEIRPNKNYVRFFDAAGKSVKAKATLKLERQCIHIELEVPSETGLKYETGDHVGIWPENDPEEVERVIKRLGVDSTLLDQAFDLKSSKPGTKTPFPTPCTVRTALTFYLDLREQIKQHQLQILAKYASDEEEKQHLWSLAANREEYLAWIETGQKSCREVLEEFPSINVPLEVLMTEILSRIQVRYYSISSSSKEDPNRIAITAVVVRYAIEQRVRPAGGGRLQTGKVTIKSGLTTGWIQRLQQELEGIEHVNGYPGVIHNPEHVTIPKFHLPMYIRKSAFKLPKDPKVPVVMVGPGTGVAPFRGFVRDRWYDAHHGKTVGPTLLFFGCRKPDEDFMYQDEWKELLDKLEQEKGTSTWFDFQLITAFSREGAKKVYVQHRLQEHAEQVWKLLKQGGHFYVCGEAKNMASDVQKTLQRIAQEQGGMTEDAAANWFKDLKHSLKYQEDVW